MKNTRKDWNGSIHCLKHVCKYKDFSAMDKVSIIIPVFNSEKFLQRCLSSIIFQTHENLEILCIDDGSTDNSLIICDEYAEKDKRVRVLRKESKGGSGSPCRSQNIGIKNATGKYVGFTDADDWLESNMIETLYHAIKKFNASVSIVNFFKDTDSDSIAMVNKKKIPDGLLSARDLLEFTFDRDNYRSIEFPAWNKLYSADLFKKNKNLYFDTTLKLAYDALFNVSVYLTDGCTGIYTDKPLYHWCQHDTSLFNSASPEMWMDTLETLNLIVDMLDKKGYSDISPLVKRLHCFWASLQVEEAVDKEDYKTLYLMQQKMKLFFNDYLRINSDFSDRIDRINYLITLK